jgi:hypothetical protein
LLFAGIKFLYEWPSEIHHGYTISSGTFWSFYYTAAGIHAAHVIAGVVIMLIIAPRAKRNLDLHRVELIGLYWHFVDVVGSSCSRFSTSRNEDRMSLHDHARVEPGYEEHTHHGDYVRIWRSWSCCWW